MAPQIREPKMDAAVDEGAPQGVRAGAAPSTANSGASAPPQARSRDARRSRLRWKLMIGGMVVFAAAALVYYLFTGRYVSTDDSSVMAAQTAISTNISGRVVELDVHDNQSVHRGDVLFRLDDRPLRIALDEAQAK